MTVVTRFAPSPTGFLHIGGARTALFNYLFAKHHRGVFLLRIEDTDRLRSTVEATQAILHGLTWLGLNWDQDVVYQSRNQQRHQEVGLSLFEKGQAYYCDCSPEFLEEMRFRASKEGRSPGYNGHCRGLGHRSGALRLRTPTEGQVTLHDHVQGTVTIRNDQIDDMVLLRSDGTPTYMLSVVVDDYDMKITHVIRGDDHLTNAFRQFHIYQAMGWAVPEFAHIPMIHGPDGSKLSKRHGAVGVEVYEEMGYLPQALRNYLLRLGWGHGDNEVISDDEATTWFSLEAVGKSPSRFDFKKLDYLNAHYLRLMDAEKLVGLVQGRLEKEEGASLRSEHLDRLKKGMEGLKQRAITLKELADNARFYIEIPPFSEEACVQIEKNQNILKEALPAIEGMVVWSHASLETAARSFCETHGIKLGQLAQTLRAALTGSVVSPGIFDVMDVLGREESILRIKKSCSACSA